MAVFFDVIEASCSTSETTEAGFSVIGLLSALSKGVFSFEQLQYNCSDRLQSLVGKLVKATAAVAKDPCERSFPSTSSALSPELVIDALLETDKDSAVDVFLREFGVPPSLSALFRIAYSTKLAASYGATKTAFEANYSSTLVLTMHKIGSYRQLGVSVFDSLYKEFLGVKRLSQSSIQRCFAESSPELQALVQAMTSVAAAMSLIPSLTSVYLFHDRVSKSESSMQDPSIDEVSLYCREGYKRLERMEGSESTDCYVLLRSIRTACRALFLLLSFSADSQQLSAEKQNDLMYDLFVDLQTARKQKETRGVLVQEAISCLDSSTEWLGDFFILRGLELEALNLSLWKEDALPMYIHDSGITSTSSSTVCLRFASPGISMLRSARPELGLQSASEPRGLEFQASFLRATIPHRDPGEAKSQLQTMLDHLGPEMEDESLDPSLSVFHRWALSTVLIGLAECTYRLGALQESLGHLRECFAICDELFCVVEGLVGRQEIVTTENVLSWNRAERLLPKVLDRQKTCLMLLAKAYSRLGDHRRAMGYADSLIERKKIGSSLVDVLASLQCKPCSNMREIRDRWLVATLRARSMPLDIVCRHVQEHTTNQETNCKDGKRWSCSDLHCFVVEQLFRKSEAVVTWINLFVLTYFSISLLFPQFGS